MCRIECLCGSFLFRNCILQGSYRRGERIDHALLALLHLSAFQYRLERSGKTLKEVLHGQSGLDMCQRIRQSQALAEVPVMFLSAAQIPDIIRRTDALGGTYYLRRPFDPGVLVELIDKALRRPQLVAGGADRQ